MVSAAMARWGRPLRMSSTKALRFPRGPTSTKMPTPSEYIASIVFWNSTGLIQCRTATSRIAPRSAGNGDRVVHE